MPKLWDATIDEHRRTVQAAILDATAALITEHGLAAVTMSRIAQRAGIGRATLYKYFADVGAIVTAWHERTVTEHLHRLTEVAGATDDPGERLRSVLHAYADLSAGRHHPPEMAGPLHRAEHVHDAHRQLHALVTDVVAAAARSGAARTDVPAAELATFCLHALNAATSAPDSEARGRMVAVTLTGVTTAPS